MTIEKIVLILPVAILAMAVLFGIGCLIYFCFGRFKFFYHDCLKYHMPTDEWYDNCEIHSKCEHCDKEIVFDEQKEAWFEIGGDCE